MFPPCNNNKNSNFTESLSIKIKLKYQNRRGKHTRHFEVRSPSKENCYKLDSPLNFIMGKPEKLANIENDQKVDYALMKRLAKIIEFLPNIED